MILSKTKIHEIHKTMLGFGKKIVKGYNLNDYNYTAPLMDRKPEDLTDRQIWVLCKVFSRYKNTQLKEYKSDIEETLSYYTK